MTKKKHEFNSFQNLINNNCNKKWMNWQPGERRRRRGGGRRWGPTTTTTTWRRSDPAAGRGRSRCRCRRHRRRWRCGTSRSSCCPRRSARRRPPRRPRAPGAGSQDSAPVTILLIIFQLTIITKSINNLVILIDNEY